MMLFVHCLFWLKNCPFSTNSCKALLYVQVYLRHILKLNSEVVWAYFKLRRIYMMFIKKVVDLELKIYTLSIYEFFA